jgi:gas vesicle structural protein
VTVATQPGGSGAVDRPSSSSLADVIDTILDKGLVIDAYVRVSLVGIELLTIDARIVVASVDTYLRFAEATNRVDLSEKQDPGLPELMEQVTEDGAQSKSRGATQGALEAAGDLVQDALGNSDHKNRERASSRGRRNREEG